MKSISWQIDNLRDIIFNDFWDYRVGDIWANLKDNLKVNIQMKIVENLRNEKHIR